MKILKYWVSISILDTLRNPLNTKLYIGPDNRVLILRKDWRTVEEGSIIFDQNGSYLYSWVSKISCSNKFYHICPKIVHHARKILERRNTEQHEENARTRLREQIFKLQNDSDKIMEMMQAFAQREEKTSNKLDILMRKLDCA